MGGERLRQGPVDSLGDAMKRIRVLERLVPTSGGGTTWPWAVGAINGFYNVPSGVTTSFGIDEDVLTTSTDDNSIFDEEEFDTGKFGLKIAAPGLYAFFWTVYYNDVSGHRVANPETFPVFAEDASGSTGTFVIAPWFFSTTALGGYSSGGVAQWDVGWMSIWATDGTTAGNPFVLTGEQSTGETLRAYTSIWAIQFSDSTHGWT